MIYTLIGCLIIIGFLVYKLSKKIKIDNEKLEQLKQDLAWYNNQVNTQKEILRQQEMDLYKLKEESKTAKEATEYEKYKLDECKKDLQAALDTYNDVVNNKMKEIDNIVEDTTNRRLE